MIGIAILLLSILALALFLRAVISPRPPNDLNVELMAFVLILIGAFINAMTVLIGVTGGMVIGMLFLVAGAGLQNYNLEDKDGKDR